MKVLFTGASSFTGCWFVEQLAAAGHEVVATFSRSPDTYQDGRGARVARAASHCVPVFDCAFGSPAFMQLLAEHGPFDVLCHHAADVTDYHSPDFDIARALQANTLNMRAALARLSDGGCSRIVLTGSIFEPGEGQGSDGLKAFSAYGLSKALTAQAAQFYADEAGMHFGKFVIPNPFGPFEEPRFTAYLVRTWAKGEVAGVRTPAYVRDNIHVDLMARAYADFVAHLPSGAGSSQLNPSGYIESQGAFAQRFARELSQRTGLACELDLNEQTDFPEPRIRVNSDPAQALVPQWSESAAWDAIAAYYEPMISNPG